MSDLQQTSPQHFQDMGKKAHPTPAEEEKRKIAITLLQLHLERAVNSRKQYWARRTKASKPENMRKGDVSMIIDGAGAQARYSIPFSNLV